MLNDFLSSRFGFNSWFAIGLCTLLTFAFKSSFGQSGLIKFDKLSTENTITVKGLSQNSIYCLMQDHKGFIWIGTWDGLNRYDAYEFSVLNTANGLSHPTINALMEDDEQNIWIGTDDGLNFLDRSTGKIKQIYQEPGVMNTLSNDFINHIYQDSARIIWISTAYGLNRYDREQGVFTYINFFERNVDSAYTNFISVVKEDKNGVLWIGTHCGVHCYKKESQEFVLFRPEPNELSTDFISKNCINDLVFDDHGRVLVATQNGIYQIIAEERAVSRLRVVDQEGMPLSGQVNRLLFDSNGQLWIGTGKGLHLHDRLSDTLTSFKAGMNVTNLSNDDIRSIFEDKAGTIWIGTYKGLNKIDRSPSRFRHYRHDPGNPNSLSDNIVYALLDDNDKVWIGTYGGINILDRVNETFSFIMHDPDDPHSISSNKIRTINKDLQGYLWVGTESSGLNRIDPASGKISRYLNNPSDPLSIAENTVISTYMDSNGRLWIGTANKGASILNPQTGLCLQLNSRPGNLARLSHDKVWCIYEDKEHNYWIGTNLGLNKVSPDLKQVSYYTHDRLNPNTISSNTIIHIMQDSEGIFWIGTMGGGLNRFDAGTEVFASFSEAEGLPNDVVYCVLEDEEKNLWLTTNRGISKFSKENETFINYDAKDGVQGNEFNAGAYYQNSKGEIFVGGMNGFNVFYPKEITVNTLAPNLVFTGFWILSALRETEPDDGQVIRLGHNENYFTIEFSGLDYTNPTKNLYKYKLDNYDEEWIVANAYQRKADYRKVAPGTYRFMVTGSNNDGVWNPDGISMTIIINPPWWQTWMFRLSAALVLITLAWSIILFRIRSIRKKHTVEKKLLSIEKQIFELEQKALRLQMNPHFIFNSLNAIQNFVLANDTDKAVNYLAKFSHLMRMILANSTASLITLKDELKALTYYIELEKLRFDDKFEYTIVKDAGIDDEFVEIPPMLFQPYVENAIIHGLVNSDKPGMLEISLKRINAGTLLCTIEDNGIGREKAIALRDKSGIKRQPRGMLITQERIEIFNKQNRKNFTVRVTDLKDNKGEAAGTRVEFTIQYKET